MDYRQTIGVDWKLSSDQVLFGVLAVDKPGDWTSRDVVNRIQRFVRPTKIGHTGTLDPMATGVLILVLGQATRLVEYAHDLRKTYESEFLLGVSSDTLDTTGCMVAQVNPPIIRRSDWTSQMPNWMGTIRQQPPKYSAIHIAGHRAHELARRGEHFEVPFREVHIYSLELLEFEYPRVRLRVQCSTGTYIRSLGNDIAAALGTCAVMSRLVRTEIGPFRLSACSQLADLDSRQAVADHLQPPMKLLEELPKVAVIDTQCQLMKHGKSLTMHECPPSVLGREDQPIAVTDSTGTLIALATWSSGKLRPIRVFGNG